MHLCPLHRKKLQYLLCPAKQLLQRSFTASPSVDEDGEGAFLAATAAAAFFLATGADKTSPFTAAAFSLAPTGAFFLAAASLAAGVAFALRARAKSSAFLVAAADNFLPAGATACTEEEGSFSDGLLVGLIVYGGGGRGRSGGVGVGVGGAMAAVAAVRNGDKVNGDRSGQGEKRQ